MDLDAVLYVNLDESTLRRKHIEDEIERCHLMGIAERWPGVRVPADQECPPSFALEALGSCYGPDQARNALGCALAHWNAYKRILERGWRNTLILEDDAIIDNGHLWVLLEEAPRDFDLLYLNRSQFPCSVLGWECGSPFERITGQLCTVGYVVNRAVLPKLIERCNPWTERPRVRGVGTIDVVLSTEFEDLKIYRPLKGAVDQDFTQHGSTITGLDAEHYRRHQNPG